MVDSFTVDLTRTLEDPSTVWREVRILADAVKKVHNNKGRVWLQPHMSSGGRKWERATLEELQDVAKEHGLVEFKVYWDYGVDGGGLMWSVEGTVWEKYGAKVEASAYAGEDRMITEQAARAVLAEAKRHRIVLAQGETEISSVDTGGTAKKKPTTPVPLRDKTSGVLSGLRAAIGRHMGAFIVTVLGTVVAAVIIVLLGLKGA